MAVVAVTAVAAVGAVAAAATVATVGTATGTTAATGAMGVEMGYVLNQRTIQTALYKHNYVQYDCCLNCIC